MKNYYRAFFEELRLTIVLSFRILCLLCQMNGSEHMKRNDIQIIQSSLMPSFYGTKAQPDSPVCMRSLLSSGAKIQNNFCDSFLDQREAYFFGIIPYSVTPSHGLVMSNHCFALLVRLEWCNPRD